MKGRCRRCGLEVDSDGCRIALEAYGLIGFIGKDGGFHEVPVRAEKVVVAAVDPAEGVGEGLGPAAAKLARITARIQAAREKENSNGND